MYGLIIRKPWIDYILDGPKTWEMRTTPAPRHERIALIRKGTGLVVGTAELVDSLAPLDAAALAASRDRHCIPAGLDSEVLKAGWVHPWVLHDIRRLTRPILAGQKPGQVIWVPLAADVVATIEAQLGVPASPAAKMATLRTVVTPTAPRTPVMTVPASPQRESRSGNDPNEITIQLTEGAIRNGNLSVRKAIHLLPDGVLGGSNRGAAAVGRVTVVFDPGETVETDIAGDKMLLRCRGAVSDFFARSGVATGDLVRMHCDRIGALRVRAVRQ